MASNKASARRAALFTFDHKHPCRSSTMSSTPSAQAARQEEAIVPKEHTAHAVLQDGMRFIGSADSGYTVAIDDSADSGGGSATTPVELALIALAGCAGMDVISILRKQRQPVRGLEVRAHGQRRDDLPKIFTTIELHFIVRGGGIAPSAIERAIELTQTRYCSVWGMLAPQAAITPSFEIVE
jgi:putative redox protein